MKKKKMTDIYRGIVNVGGDISTANLIMLWHARPAKKLRGMLRLVEAGHTVTTARFALDVLLIDGKRAPWSALEEAASRRATR